MILVADPKVIVNSQLDAESFFISMKPADALSAPEAHITDFGMSQ